MMLVRSEKFIGESVDEDVALKKFPKDEFMDKVTEEHAIRTYKTSVRCEAKQFEKINTTSTLLVREKLMTHALACCEKDGSNILPEQQTIGAFTGKSLKAILFH